MSWIKTIDFSQATGTLKKIYEKITGPDQNVDNVLQVHSLRPHTLRGHMELYKSVLHHANNTLPNWYLEAIGTFVSFLNQCDYCVDHHAQGLKRLLNDDEQFNLTLHSIQRNRVEEAFEGKELAGMNYAKKLTLSHHWITKKDFDNLKEAGFDDGEILEINQVVSYFNYVNRTVVGLGVTTEGDILGLSPNNQADTEDWTHH
ncbi:MAG: peroxidase-related enzyme [Bacteroidota bacterium]